MKHKIWVSTVTHRHGTNSHAAGSEAGCRLYGSDVTNIDAGAYASRGEDGVRVAAWVLVPNEKAAS